MRLARALGLASGSSLMLAAPLLAQNPPPPLPTIGTRFGTEWNPRPTDTLSRELWTPDGSPTSFSVTPDRVLVCGGFNNIGLSTGSSAKLALADATVDMSWPRTDGPVYSIISDGAGGWYLGGNFSLIESLPRRCLAHVLPNGDVDPAFDAQVSGNQVRALLVANGVLYVAGSIGSVAGAARQALCAVDAQSGVLLPWNPILGPSWGSSSSIRALAIHGDRIYAGGDFQETVQGVLRKRLMLIDRVTALVSAWDPALDGAVFDMCLDGTSLVLGGNFEQIFGAARSKVAVLDAPTGSLGPFSTTFNSTVWSLALDGGTLFTGGYFSVAGGVARSRAAAFDFSTSALLAWNPNLSVPEGGSLVLNDIAISGGDVVLAGHFTQVGVEAREHVAVVDRLTGAPRTWHSKLRGGTPSQAFSAAVAGSSTWIGGDFKLASCKPSAGVFALSLDDGQPTNWSPMAPGVQETLQVGGSVYLGGTLATVNGLPRKLIAAVDATNGTTTLPFDASASFPVQTAYVRALAFGNGMLYAGGDFFTSGGVHGLIALDPITGALIPGWNSSIGGSVNDICLSEDGSRLYVGGQFTQAGNPPQPRLNFAVINALTGAVLPTICNANGVVHCVLAAAGRVYLGGSFQTLNGQTVERLGQINGLTGTPYDWTPLLNPGGGTTYVNSMSRQGRLIYIGGRFDRINGVWRPWLGAVDAEFAIMANWMPVPSNEVYAVAAARGRVFVAGGFSSLAGVAMPNMGAFEIQ